MTPNDTTAQSQTDSISLEFDLHHQPEKVWRALTDPVLLAEWLLEDKKHERGTSVVTPPAYTPALASTSPRASCSGSIRAGFPADFTAWPPVLRVCRRSPM